MWSVKYLPQVRTDSNFPDTFLEIPLWQNGLIKISNSNISSSPFFYHKGYYGYDHVNKINDQ